jgi:hypothetical protein
LVPTSIVISFFACVAIVFLLHLGFVFASDNGSAAIGVVVRAADGLNLYVYVGNNPLKYRDPTGHFPLVSWDSFVNSVNAYKASQRELDIWVGENHYTPQGNYLAIKLNDKIKFQNFIKEAIVFLLHLGFVFASDNGSAAIGVVVHVYDYQGNRVRTVIESSHQVQSQRDYLPALDIV